MKLTKKTAALAVAGVLTLGLISAPLIADRKDSCGGHGYGGKYSMMGHHGFMGKNTDRMIHRLAEKLDMTEEQRTQAFAKLDEYRPKLREAKFAIKDNFKTMHELDPDSEDFQTKSEALADEQGNLIAEMIKLRFAVHADIEQILTEEQKAKFEKFKHRRSHHRGHDWDENTQS